MYSVNVAADIFHQKTNFELTFPTRPTIGELRDATEKAFSAEIHLRRPDNVPPHSFNVMKLKVHDDVRNKWVDLTSETQLSEFCQCYAFQHENRFHKESQKEIPPATRPPTVTAMSNGGVNVARSSTSVRHTSNVRDPSVAYRSTTTNVSAGSAPRPSPNATQDERIRVVFREFDTHNTHMLQLEDLKQMFASLGIELSQLTISDLFQKGDVNSDGRISFSEFERFAKLYPILTDCLYYHSKSLWDDDHIVRAITVETEQVQRAETNASQAAATYDERRRTAEDLRGRISVVGAELGDLVARAQDVEQQHALLQKEKDKAAKDRFERESEITTVREKERQQRHTLTDLTRDAEKAERRRQAAAADAAKAEERVKQLEAELAEAHRAMERARAAAKQAQTDIEGARSKEQDLARGLEHLAREVQKVEMQFRDADVRFNTVLGRLQETDVELGDLQRRVKERRAYAETLEHDAANARNAEAQAQADLDRARNHIEERRRVLKTRQEERIEYQRQRLQVSEEERRLISQELRLREQRDTLEEKESRLRNDAGAVLSSVRAALLQRVPTVTTTTTTTTQESYDKYDYHY